jgi:hypothetical protein
MVYGDNSLATRAGNLHRFIQDFNSGEAPSRVFAEASWGRKLRLSGRHYGGISQHERALLEVPFQPDITELIVL